MFIRYSVRYLSSLDENEIEALYKRSLTDGRMKEVINLHKSNSLEYDVLIVRAHHLGRVIGWAMSEEDPSEENFPMGIFVNKKYRRLGIGTSLIERLCKHYSSNLDKIVGKQLHAIPWDNKGNQFFNKNKNDSIRKTFKPYKNK